MNCCDSWPWPLTFWLRNKWVSMTHHVKSGDPSYIGFWDNMRKNRQTHRQTEVKAVPPPSGPRPPSACVILTEYSIGTKTAGSYVWPLRRWYRMLVNCFNSTNNEFLFMDTTCHSLVQKKRRASSWLPKWRQDNWTRQICGK